MKTAAEKLPPSPTATPTTSQPFFAKEGIGHFFEPHAQRPPPGVQPKLTVNQPGDAYEQEADKLADQVLRMPSPPKSAEKLPPLPTHQLPRQATETSTAPGSDSPAVTAAAQAALEQSISGGQPLPGHVRSYMEPRFGVDFGGVRVHTDPNAARLSQELRAQAFTYRQHIFYGAGKMPANDALTAHELAHVVQQRSMDPGHGLIQRDPLSPPETEEKQDDSLTDKFLQRLGPFGISLGNDGRIYFFLSRFTLLNGRASTESVPISEVGIESPPIPLEIPGLTATASFKFKLSAEVGYILDPVELTNIRLGVSKTQAMVFLLPLLNPFLLGPIVFSPALFFLPILLGRPPLWLREARGTAQIQTGGSAKAGIAFEAFGEASLNAGSSKFIKLLALAAGVSGAVGSQLSATAKVEGLAMAIEGNHLKMSHRRDMQLQAGVFASLAAFLQASALNGLISKRITRSWTREKSLVDLDLANYEQGAIDIDYDNGLKDEKKLIQLDGQKLKQAIGLVAEIKKLFGPSEKTENVEVTFKTNRIPVELADGNHSLSASNEEDNAKAIVYLNSDPEEFSAVINAELTEIRAEQIQLAAKQKTGTLTGPESQRLSTINGDILSLQTIISAIREIESKINNDFNTIIKGASKASESDAFLERRKAATEAELNSIAAKNRKLLVKVRFKHTPKFFKEVPTRRYIPGPGKGDTIRSVLYDNLHNWKSMRNSVYAQEYTPLLTKITNAQDAANKGFPNDWNNLVKTELYIKKGALPASYNPDEKVVKYEVDHEIPVSKLWNSGGFGFPAGFDAADDQMRGNAFLFRKNLRLITAEKNSALSSSAPRYNTFVGPNFKSIKAENNKLKAKLFNGSSFVDSNENPLVFD